MTRTAAIAIGAIILAGAACPRESELPGPPKKTTGLPRPRPAALGVHNELDAARRAGTIEAYDLFLARHGDHRLAAAARRERAALAARTPARPTTR